MRLRLFTIILVMGYPWAIFVAKFTSDRIVAGSSGSVVGQGIKRQSELL